MIIASRFKSRQNSVGVKCFVYEKRKRINHHASCHSYGVCRKLMNASYKHFIPTGLCPSPASHSPHLPLSLSTSPGPSQKAFIRCAGGIAPIGLEHEAIRLAPNEIHRGLGLAGIADVHNEQPFVI
jgi:hypothetical protein